MSSGPRRHGGIVLEFPINLASWVERPLRRIALWPSFTIDTAVELWRRRHGLTPATIGVRTIRGYVDENVGVKYDGVSS
jgi:hypothetical protein